MSLKNNRILPDGYYRILTKGAFPEDGALFQIKLLQGPFQGIKFRLADRIKIREEALTGTPQLLYNYKILDFAQYQPREVETSESFSRIVAAIAVELLSEQIENGAALESL